MDNSHFYIPRPILKLIIIAGLMWGIVISIGLSASGARPLVAIASVVLAPMAILIWLYFHYLIVYIIWRLFWFVVGIAAAISIFLVIAGLVWSDNILAFAAGIMVLLVSLILWGALDRWLPGERPARVTITNEWLPSRPRRVGRSVEPSFDEPEPEHPTRPRRPSPPPGRPDPDRINKELAERKRRMGTN